MNTFCTIITKNYLPYAIALYKSLYKFNHTVSLQVLVVDDEITPEQVAPYAGISIIPITDIMDFHLTGSLYRKYAHTSTDNFRWALKPVLLLYLLETGFEKVIFTDCDIYFYDDYKFLIDKLDHSDILLTPHWRCSNPLVNEPAFISLFSDGIYNAGFIGAAKSGIPALNWWAHVCHYKMETMESIGFREDQGYLNVVPVLFEKVEIIRHRGCNISAWNQEECRRVMVGNKVLINGEYPIVFMHYNTVLFTEILKGHDRMLQSYLNEYKKTFEENGSLLASFHNGFDFYYKPSQLQKLKWTLMIRTRAKRWLFALARKL